MKKRILAFLMVLVMCLSLLPATALATVAETDVAKIGDTGYATLKEAVTAANYGDTITLLKDVTTDAEKYYGINLGSKVITLDLDGHTLSSSMQYAVNIAGANVTIKNGTVKSSNQTAIMVNGTNTTLTLDSVTLVNTNQNGAHYSLYAQYSGESGSPNSVIIKGDTKFIYDPDGTPQTGEFYIAQNNVSAFVQAGTYNFDPTSYVGTSKFWVDSTNSSNNEWKVYTLVAAPEAKTGLAETDEEQIGVAEGEGYTLSGVTKAADKGSYTAYATPSEGYVWADNHGTEQRTINWSIAEASAAAKIGETGYATLARAYNAATNGDTITLLADATAEAKDYGITIEKNITLDLGSKTLSSTKYIGVWVKAGNVTIKNGTITGSGTITLAASTAANLMLDSVTVEYTGSNTPYAALNTDCNSLTIKGNTKLLDKEGNVGYFAINSQNIAASVEAGTYNFDPTSYVDSTKFYVDRTSAPTSYVVKPIAAAPEAKTGLVENDTEQTGVEEGEGYTLSGTTKATTAGEYTAYATPATGYVWSDGTTAEKEIKWSIAQAATVAKIGDTEFKTLAGALKAAQSGTGDGKTVTVVGAVNGYNFDGNYDSIIIKGSDTGKITGNFTAAKDASLKNVKFLNLKFEGCGIDFSNAGLQFENAVIQDCTFDGTKIPAEKRQQAITINVHHADKLLIDNNTIKNYTSADSSGGSSAILLGTVRGFDGFVEGHSVTISNNTIDNIAYNAIQATDLAKLVISNNTISNAKKNKGPINLNNTKEVEISGNTITLAEGYKGVYYNVNEGIVILSNNTIKKSASETLTFDETLANVNNAYDGVTDTGILVLKGATEADNKYIAVSKDVIITAFPGKNVLRVPNTSYTYSLRTGSTVVAKIGDTEYTSLQAALDALKDGNVIVLQADIDYATDGTGLYNITKSVTIDGNGHTISGWGDRNGSKTTLAINNGGSSAVNVTLKNLTVINDAVGGRAIETCGNIGSLTLENCTVKVTKMQNPNPRAINITEKQESTATVNIKNSTIDAGKQGYPVYVLNPVTLNIEGSTLTGYCGVYLNEPALNDQEQPVSAGAFGSVVNAENSIFNAPNNYDAPTTLGQESWNDFGVFVMHTDGIKINLNNCEVDASCKGTAKQQVFSEDSYVDTETQSNVYTVTGSNTKIKGDVFDETYEYNFENRAWSIKAGLFNEDVSNYVAPYFTCVDNEGDDRTTYPYKVTLGTITVAKAQEGDPATEVADPVYGTASTDHQLFTVTKDFEMPGSSVLAVQWKYIDGQGNVTWNTNSPATGLSLTNDGKASTTAATPAGSYVFRITNGLDEMISDPADGTKQIANPEFISSGAITLTVGKLAWDAPAANTGYTLDFANETLKADTGYEVSSSNSTLTDLNNNKIEPSTTEKTYYVRKAADDNHTASAWTAITIPARPATPSTSVASTTANSITVTAVTGAEYSVDGTNWQDSNVFTQLEAATSYTVYVRIKAVADTSFASEAQTIQNVYTNAATPASGDGYSIDYAAEKVTVAAGYEVSKSNNPFTKETLTDSKLTIEPNTTYYIRKAASGSVPASEAVSLTTPARPTTPNTPELVSNTDTAVTVTAVNGQEYSLNGTTWQDNNEFTGLTAGTTYSIYTRVKAVTTGDNKAFASASSEALSVTTKTAPVNAPSIIPTVTATTVILPVSGEPNTYEYSTDGTNWNSNREFTGLTAATQYTYYVRIKGSDTAMPSQTATVSGYTAAATPANVAETGTVSYSAETFELKDGYEISTKNGTDSGNTFEDGKLTPDTNKKVTLEPNTTYYIRKAASGSVPASETINLTIPARPATPASAPVLDSKTDTTITITAVGGQEYSADGINWFSGGSKVTITGLTANTTYNVIARVKEISFIGNESFASLNSPASVITTKSAEQSKAAADPVDVVNGEIESGGKKVEIKDENGEDIASEDLAAVAAEINDILNNDKVNDFGKTNDDTGIIAATDASKSTIAEALKATTADQTAKDNVTEKNIDKYLNVTLVSAEVDVNTTGGTTVTVNKMVFDVTPMATITVTGSNGDVTLTTEITNDEIGGNVTFLLPVDKSITETTVAVYHEDEFLGNYPIKTDGSGNKYIEVTTDSFSEFSYIILNESTAGAKIGTTLYASLSDAVSAVQNNETITLLKNASGTITVSRNVRFTVDDNSNANTAEIVAGSGYTVSERDNTYTVSKIYYDASYSVELPTNVKNGKLAVSPKNASSGQTVTITVTPDKGFTLETLTVLNKNGKEIEVKNLGNNKYSFKMPSSKVTISATFMEDNSMLNFFVDVKATDYFYDAVLWAAENGITKGTDEVHFSPDMGTTRAQVVTFLWRAAGCPEPDGNASKFTDVVKNSYYEKAVAWAIEQGITKGTSENKFSPDMVCTRGQIVTFLARFAGVKDEDAGYTHNFTDVKATDYYNNAVAWAKDNKVTEGTTATTFSPNADCTRGQIVTFLYRWMVK